MRCLCLAALISCAAACSNELSPPPPTSSELPTSAISLDVALQSNGAVVQIVVTLLHESAVTSLSGEDQLLFGPAGAPSQELTRFERERVSDTEDVDESDRARRSQSAYLGQLPAGATELELVLSRGDGARAVSAFTLPSPFALSVPAAPVSRAQPIPLTWDVGTDPYNARLEIDSPCLTQWIARGFEFDPGAFEVQPADLFLAEGTADCDFRAAVTRAGADGSARLAPELGPVHIAPWIEQVRVATFATVP